jgi:hypothetical protein
MQMRDHIKPQPDETVSDSLENLALEETVKRERVEHAVSVLLLPAGRCTAAQRFARLGARVLVGDQPGRRQEVDGRILANGFADQITFAEFDMASPPDPLPGEPFDVIVVRRGLCGLPYADASRVVRQLLFKLRIGGKLFVTITGLHSELGDAYPDAERPVAERYAELAPAMAARYDLHGPVCLYSERDLFMLLLDAGASVLRTMTTTYGSVQGVAVRI